MVETHFSFDLEERVSVDQTNAKKAYAQVTDDRDMAEFYALNEIGLRYSAKVNFDFSLMRDDMLMGVD
ncbi:hypothetical protein X801_03200 [Opisthorchis viverrini]|uniref:Uncharacterized protein n=1 Tax=Opisthorchis viverrini TaxID=6198 RepID=A0A1S8X2G9_OPIVI|nr:hypothetical protein X801_03200 [Opisthorchis viverrini]